MKSLYVLSVFLAPVFVGAQSLLQLGMTVMTHVPEDTTSEYVLNVYDTRNVAASAPQGNNWGITNLLPPSPYDATQWKMSRMGQVFGVTIDGTGNMYVAASSSYPGIPPVYGSAGGGGIYRVNANDWSVSDFVVTDPNPTSTSTTMIPNTGTGLGNITYDQYNNQLFATNFEDGKIYRIDLQGNILSTFDPYAADDGVAGPPVAGEQIWGIAVYSDGIGNTRVYFSNWSVNYVSNVVGYPFDKNSIWSVALDANGAFSGTEQLEFQVPDFFYPSNPSPVPGSPVSCLNFSNNGVMLCAERSMFQFVGVSAHQSRVYTLENTSGTWALERMYNIGVIGVDEGLAANSAGGADFGYNDDDPEAALNGCEQLIWGSSDAIKYDSYNPDQSSDKVYGLAGLPRSGNSTVASSPDFVYTSSYMIDLNNILNDQPKSWLGSCAVYSDCQYDPCEDYNCTMINVITPNGDGKNDFLAFRCIGGADWGLDIYNRWGNQLYTSKSYGNDWDGTGYVDGVYYYILTSPCDGRKMNGFFHLLRNQP